MDNKWVKIYSSNQYFQSEIVKQVLVDHDIDAIIMNKQDSSYKFGEVEVHINQTNFDKALAIILENDL
ncbi:DUF2007 domain-containing protein [Pedobacter sp. SD-b]|uniref:DUF2007 domain-containing protein n=1 Tax=Pedobacter segetis TaxID=2793069 RepID=A0ABS1BLM2_9SPHI|nr:DUF2007 domain-containing protein [Pedobacter segetis]MBK0383216.1 DUF2007 domain-containing protein [Pedobacter segetis]